MSLGKIAIVGAGAVGSYYGARLAQAGEEVTFMLRSDYAHVKENGIQVCSVAGDIHLHPVKCAQNPEEIGIVDLVIVAWKTTANAFAKDVITPLIGEETCILTLQNGLGNCEHLGNLFGAHRILGGLCFVCINRLSPGVISHTASGLVRVGAYQPAASSRVREVVKAMSRAAIPCEEVESLEKALWMKLVWNIPFNGLAIAEGGVDTEVLLHELQLEPSIRELMHEVVSVAAALGHKIPEEFIDHQISITRPMQKYRPSSMIDFVEGRPVEVDAIWGIPLRTARQQGVNVPAIQALTARIKDRIYQRDH